jgi:catechol 2,3-dioxygenase-like lactoylglutathione lyase family enzyme
MKPEVVVLGVSDVDRAKAFYEKLGWRLDAGRARAADRVSRRLFLTLTAESVRESNQIRLQGRQTGN